MDDNVVKTCNVCNTEKSIAILPNKQKECKQCKMKKVLKRYCNIKDDIIQKFEINMRVLKTWIIE